MDLRPRVLNPSQLNSDSDLNPSKFKAKNSKLSSVTTILFSLSSSRKGYAVAKTLSHGRTSAHQSAGTRLKSENLGFPFSVTLLVEKETDRDGGFRLRWRSVVESSGEAVANGEGFAVGVRSQGRRRGKEKLWIRQSQDTPNFSFHQTQYCFEFLRRALDPVDTPIYGRL
ncbi:hypothetical protein LXL04_037085 [Taraxacum kok-saghyz]